MLVNHLFGLATLGILFAAQNFHHSLLLVHPPEELLARKVRSLFYGCVLLPICRLSGKWFAPRTAVLRSATLTSTTWQAVLCLRSYNLRSSDSILLSMPAVRSKTLGDRAFMVAAPRLWNSLPKDFRAVTNVNSFKAHIKTYLFKTL